MSWKGVLAGGDGGVCGLGLIGWDGWGFGVVKGRVGSYRCIRVRQMEMFYGISD